MSDETGKREQVDRCERARAILDDPLVVEAFETIDRRIFESWKASSQDDCAHRDRLYLLQRVAGEFRNHFEQVVKTGTLAAHDLKAAETPEKERKSRHV